MATAITTIEAENIGEARRDLGPLFVGTIFVGSFLLFLVQPMVARMALPRLGGAPAVWNSAMLVYQALLLGGYAYAHAIARLNVRVQSLVQLMVLAASALLLPLHLIGVTPSTTASPALWVPWLLLVSIGPLFFAVSAQAPLIQRWYAAATGGKDPYPLYAASNLGSFSGLLSYPLLVEPRLAIAQQTALWTGGYVLLVVLTLICAAVLPRAGLDTSDAGIVTEAPPTLKRRLWWILLAFVPSGLMLSTTTYLTTDIMAMPLIWVIPLSLYLLSFTLAFGEGRGVVISICRLSPVVVLTMGGISLQNASSAPLVGMMAELLLLFVVAVTLHSQMYASRPAPVHLTSFYLSMSIGGVLGGIFSGLIAPLLFDWTYEHPLLILLAGALVPQAYLFSASERLWQGGAGRRWAITIVYALVVAFIAWAAIRQPWPWLHKSGPMFGAAAIGIITLLCIGRRPPFLIGLAAMVLVFGGWDAIQRSLHTGERYRSYFGIYTIRDEGDVRTLAHGTTAHGMQRLTPGHQWDLTSYYTAYSGVGQAMSRLPAILGPNARVGAVGLGAGTLACYAQPGQDWRFFEIDPTVVHISRESGSFSFLSHCKPDAKIVLGDARLSLGDVPANSFDFLVLDAFSSDAIPMHLLTREAFGIYSRVVAPHGMLLVHISNRFLDLEPVVAEAAREGGWQAARYDDMIVSGSDNARYTASSNWILMTRDPEVLRRVITNPPTNGKWRPLRAEPGFTGWSDDYATILPLLKAFR
ncbi:spermidine synthase [Sphingomonas tabacisoli]|uniref:Spermidine synthase n=1 Tax=Sphingomonas tabacisoli TaxID=2249466 RepID=A0ABW4I554_9SPHN